MLALRLEALGIGVLLTREPGGSPGAEIIRHVLLSGAAKPLGPGRRGDVIRGGPQRPRPTAAIKPALDAGKWVVCDRFADSTRVYQGVLGDVDPRLIKASSASPSAISPEPDLHSRHAGRGRPRRARKRRGGGCRARPFRGGGRRVSREAAPGLSGARRARAASAAS